MSQYKVLSDRCSLGEQGTIVTPTDMSDDNLAALVQGGHLEPVKAKASDKDKDN